MKTSKIFIYAVVLWTLAESRHAGLPERSLEVESRRSNLTQKQQQEVIHADVLQHFTSTPSAPLESAGAHADNMHQSTSSYIKDVPFIPEDINVQNLKNDDHLSITYDRRITIDKKKPSAESPEENNKTAKSSTNDVISYKYNQTGPSSSTRSETLISHSSYEHSSTSIAYDKDSDDPEENKVRNIKEHHAGASSTTESFKVDPQVKSFDLKKKEKGKKEIPDSVTVATDYNGAGRLEKPYKDNIVISKLKEKTKEIISEALDERRSTTRVSNSDSISVSEHDNNKPLGSLELLKVGSSSINNEDLVNQSVNSVINGNGVNSDSLKKLRVKYSVKRAHDVANDTEADNSSAVGNLLNEDSAKDTVPISNLEPQTTPSSTEASLTSVEKLTNAKQYPAFRRRQSTESTPTKIEMLRKYDTPFPTTIVKPSIAFKQQLANKLKGLDPTPTAPMSAGDDAVDDTQDKSNGKSSTKVSLRKKPKPDYYASSSEMYIPPTATAWTLVAMKSAADGVRTSRNPSLGTGAVTPSETEPTSTPRQTTITPVFRVKSFVPWSTRLYKTTSQISSTTPSVRDTSSTESASPYPDSEMSPSLSKEKLEEKSDIPKLLESPPLASSTEEHSVIRTTLELDRNMTETSINLIQPSLNDVMIKDQSSTVPQGSEKIPEAATTEGVAVSNTTTENAMISMEPIDEEVLALETLNSEKENRVAEKENIIETKKPSDVKDSISKTKIKPQIKIEEKITTETPNNTANEVSLVHVGEYENKVSPVNLNQSVNITLTTGAPVIEDVDGVKMKNTSEVGDLDPGTSDILVDGTGEDGKSGEESEEEDKPKQTTTPPMFEPFETTAISDLDEDVEGENEREDEEMAIINDKLTGQTTTENVTISNQTDTRIQSTTSTSLLPLDVNNTGTYVTSFDIVSKLNTTQVVTKTPSEGDINWYNVDTKPVTVSVDETSQEMGPVNITTTAVMETTIEPETTTESSKQETTVEPETTESAPVTTLSPTTTTTTATTTALVTDPTVALEEDADMDRVEDPTSCVRIVVHVSPSKLCHGQQQLRESIAAQLVTENVSWEQVLIMSKKLQDCEVKELSTADQLLEVDVCFVDKEQEPSPEIRDEFLKLYTKRAHDPSFPIVEVQMIMQPPPMTSGFDNVLAAIVLSVIAAICLVLLGILLVIIRKRQGRFNYGQRCTPVSLDDYSLDNISVYNSVRRKGALRASKRSYGNPGFDDPGGPTHPINFAGLANFSNDRDALDEEFNQIPMITVKPDELPPGAESKNRYANVIPLPETRVPLLAKEGADTLDEYINANYIKGTKSQEKLYIACQAPLQSTVEDFWRMVWQQQSKVILMLTALNENGVEKCADYLPQLEITDCHRLFGDFQVTLKKHEVREKYIISSLQLKNLETNLWREVTHLWYSSWPPQGVPEDGSAMIAFLIEARSYMRGAKGPTVVHCSPGTGRTGTVVAIDLCIRDFETIRSVDIPKTVYALRRDRAGAVQTKDQYAFIYQVLNLYATKLTGGALDSI